MNDKNQIEEMINDKVVLTKEEYRDLKLMADSFNPFWFCSSGCEGYHKNCHLTCLDSILVKYKIKGAHEFAKTLKSVVWEEWPNETIRIKDLHRVIDDILDCHYKKEEQQ